MNSGIYKITNIANGKFYIGSAVNIKNRFSTHISELNSHKHDNRHLQRAWDKYGKDNFKFELIEEVKDKELLLEREQFYIDNFNPDYNICRVAGNTAGRKFTEETKRKISENHADVSGENNPMFGMRGELSPNYGKQHKDETKEKIRLAIGDRSGYNNPMHGRKHSPETLEKMRKRWEERKSQRKPNV